MRSVLIGIFDSSMMAVDRLASCAGAARVGCPFGGRKGCRPERFQTTKFGPYWFRYSAPTFQEGRGGKGT
jgi:hypothetical protein